MKFKTVAEIRWFKEIYYSDIKESMTKGGMWRYLWKDKRNYLQLEFLDELIRQSALKPEGEVRTLGKMKPIFSIDKKRMRQILEDNEEYKFFVDIFKQNKIVFP